MSNERDRYLAARRSPTVYGKIHSLIEHASTMGHDAGIDGKHVGLLHTHADSAAQC